ncbi:MAG TPA: pilus assembly PilX N-terminal domain-containing protein [Gaiellaceae bacterium]|nr:pilus assembly PilX N-terminal domain-containing protein [Gaiellaceae bacterium]
MSELHRSGVARRLIPKPAAVGLPSRLLDESGIALVMALAIILVLTIMVTATLAFTSANSRDASLKQQGQSAYSLAEAGLSQAEAQLYSHYYDTSGNASQNTTVYDPTWFTASGVPSSQQSPTSTAACTSASSCMSWGPTSYLASGSANVKGVLVLHGTGRVPNPTGGTQLTRTVTDTIYIEQLPQYTPPPSYWTELYSGSTGQPCDLQLGQTVNANAPIYVAGNLCLTSAASIEGSAVTLKVQGNVRLQNGGADIGKTTAVTSVQVAGGCVKSNNGAYITPCPINTATTSIFDRSGRTTAPAPAVETLPAVDWAGIAAEQAASTVTCTNGVSLSSATFYLTPASGAGSTGYTCTVADGVSGGTVGSVTYNSVAHTVALYGYLYFSGNLDLSNSTPVTYTGVSSFFVNGTTFASNGTVLCVHVASGNCDTANATNTSSPDYWDTTKSVFIIESRGLLSSTNLGFQGGLYSATEINLGGGQGSTQGPLVSPSLVIPGQSLNLSFPNFPFIESFSDPNFKPKYTLFSAGGSF